MQSWIQSTHGSGHCKFFRIRLLISSPEQISSYVDRLDQEDEQIRSESLRLAWYMRGGATYNDVMQMSSTERKLVSELAKENIETTKKSNLPYF